MFLRLAPFLNGTGEDPIYISIVTSSCSSCDIASSSLSLDWLTNSGRSGTAHLICSDTPSSSFCRSGVMRYALSNVSLTQR